MADVTAPSGRRDDPIQRFEHDNASVAKRVRMFTMDTSGDFTTPTTRDGTSTQGLFTLMAVGTSAMLASAANTNRQKVIFSRAPGGIGNMFIGTDDTVGTSSKGISLAAGETWKDEGDDRWLGTWYLEGSAGTINVTVIELEA